jgi:hypothetical protein
VLNAHHLRLRAELAAGSAERRYTRTCWTRSGKPSKNSRNPPPDRQSAASEIEGAAGDLEAALQDRLVSDALGLPLLQKLAAASRCLAVEAINPANGGGGQDKFRIQKGDGDDAAVTTVISGSVMIHR